uniref:Uncharacterized protein n=1 Tax=Ditylenchus dipsaci TaxID=166011 RepID=A0A915ECL5_9BILA
MDKKRLNFNLHKSEEYYNCGYVTHVEKAGFILGVVGSIIASCILIGELKLHNNVYQLVFMAIVLVSYLMVAASKYAKLPNLCWLAMIMNPVCVGLLLVTYVYPDLVFVTGPDYYDDFRDYRTQKMLLNLARTMACLELVVAFFGICAITYSQSVIYRFYCWMKKQNNEVVIQSDINIVA